jgi:hypothetical protein
MRITLLFGALFLIAMARASDGEKVPGKNDDKGRVIKIDGDWSAVYVEMDGKAVDLKKFTDIKIKNNVVTCIHDGKVRTFRLEFGPHHMVRCSEENSIPDKPGDKRTYTHHGVYVAAQHHLCLSLNRGMDTRFILPNGENTQGKDDNQPRRWEGRGPTGADLVIILRRSGVAIASTP